MNKDIKQEFMVIVSGGSQLTETKDSFATIKLPAKNYKAQKWSKVSINSTKKFDFVDVESDILEQVHFDYNAAKFIDYEMIIPTSYQPNRLVIFKII